MEYIKEERLCIAENDEERAVVELIQLCLDQDHRIISKLETMI